MYFGVADNGTLVGLDEPEKDAEVISEAIKVHLNPIPDIDISFEKIEGATIIVVKILAGQQTPYYYKGDGQLIAYIRIGNESVPAEPLKIRELVLKGSGETYDSLKSRYSFSDMSFTKLKSVYKQRTGNTFEESDYESFGLIDENGDLTNAGALLADESPVKQSRLFCTRWCGKTKADGIIDAIDDKEYSGGLVVLLQAGIDFVTNNSKKAWRKESDRRIDMPDYPERAILEGIVNALIHRSYTELGSEVHIDMFDDRIEIYSPGGMVSSISLKDRDILKIPSKRRNPILADIFSRLKYMERRGSGFKKIISDYEKQQNYSEKLRPIFDGEYDDFTLTLFNVNYNDTQDDTQESIEVKIEKLIRGNNKISTKEIAKKLNVGVATIKRKIKAMSNLKYIGSGYSGHWELDE